MTLGHRPAHLVDIVNGVEPKEVVEVGVNAQARGVERLAALTRLRPRGGMGRGGFGAHQAMFFQGGDEGLRLFDGVRQGDVEPLGQTPGSSPRASLPMSWALRRCMTGGVPKRTRPPTCRAQAIRK